MSLSSFTPKVMVASPGSSNLLTYTAPANTSFGASSVFVTSTVRPDAPFSSIMYSPQARRHCTSSDVMPLRLAKSPMTLPSMIDLSPFVALGAAPTMMGATASAKIGGISSKAFPSSSLINSGSMASPSMYKTAPVVPTVATR